MKTIIRNAFVLSVAAIMWVGCNPEPRTEDKSDKKAEILTFGFYAEDNKNVLETDYVAEAIGRDIIIRLPEEVNKTSLIARFTTTDDDIVKIDDTVQESGVTANDFTEPVDYIVNDPNAKLSTPYTVRVKKILEMKWEYLGVIAEPDNNSTELSDYWFALDKQNGTPYVFYARNDTETTSKGVVIKWDGENFISVGPRGFTDNRVRQPFISVAPDGTPYVMYIDGTASRSSTSVMSYKSGSWGFVGLRESFGPTLTNGQALTIQPNGEIVAASVANISTSDRRWLNVTYFNGATWSNNAVFTLAPAINGSTNVVYRPRIELAGEKIYMGAAFVNSGYGLYEYANGQWSEIRPVSFIDNSTTADLVNLNDCIEMAAAPDGSVYFALFDNSVSKDNPGIQLLKYNGTACVKYGSPLSAPASAMFDLAIDNNNIPHIVYTAPKTGEGSDVTYILMLSSLNTDTMQWNDPQVLADQSLNKSSEVFIDFDNKGNAFAVCSERMTVEIDDETSVRPYVFYVYRYAMEQDAPDE